VHRSRITVSLALTAALIALATPTQASGQEWSPPVDGPVVRGYERPSRPYGPRHLGLDYAVPPGTPVRAAGDGVVAFAGLVGGSRAAGIEHPGARRTTYAYLSRVAVRPGTPVRRGDVLGFSGGAGPGHTAQVVHFGYRHNGSPEDPAGLFQGPPHRISLAPIDAPACRYTGPQPGRPRSGIHTPAGSNGVRP